MEVNGICGIFNGAWCHMASRDIHPGQVTVKYSLDIFNERLKRSFSELSTRCAFVVSANLHGINCLLLLLLLLLNIGSQYG